MNTVLSLYAASPLMPPPLFFLCVLIIYLFSLLSSPSPGFAS
jgi:hypothetical protein